MSLISQNAVLSKNRENKDDEIEKHVNGSPSNEIEQGPNLSNPKKRKKDRKSKEQSQMDIEKAKMKNEKEMKRLEGVLFGSLYNPPKFGEEIEVEKKEAPLFFMDKSMGDEMIVYEEDLNEDIGLGDVIEEKQSAWVDEEEESTEIDIIKVRRLRKLRKEAGEVKLSGKEYIARLRAQHRKLNPGTEWANFDRKTNNDVDSDDEENDINDSGVTMAHGYEDNSIFRSNEELVVKSSSRLLPNILEYTRLMDANTEEPNAGIVTSVQFHRNGQLLLTAGLDKRLRFFQVDGKRNTKVQSIFFENFPIHKAAFLNDGSQVILSSKRKFFHTFDLVKSSIDKIWPAIGREEKSLETFEVSPDSKLIAFAGLDGYILLVSTSTKELVGTLKMNGEVRSIAFADNGNQLLSTGTDGEIYHWDIRTRTCFHRAKDEGCIIGTSLCTSYDGSLFAAGSNSGIVNIYKRDEFLGGKRKPLKVVENLTTDVEFMKFNHDAQLLAICSSKSKNGLKLVHVPSLTVFSNWPPPRFSLQKPKCLDFSPGGGFVAVGNSNGKVLLYKLHHYHKA